MDRQRTRPKHDGSKRLFGFAALAAAIFVIASQHRGAAQTLPTSGGIRCDRDGLTIRIDLNKLSDEDKQEALEQLADVIKRLQR